MSEWLDRALQLAVENVDNGGHPFGAVLTINDEVVAEGVNTLHETPDVTGHAEIVAMRKEQLKRGSTDLSDCTMYASGEPCPMCLTAMYFAGIQTVYYAQSVEEASGVGLGMSGKVYRDLQKPQEDRQITMIHQPVKNPQLDAMKHYQTKE
ncbi:nucleoside deaminase [Halobacillus locisalis]|uniref:Nucleoside deaminase n=1 Tax=Halobacillus locisalis TaxID=220753 RepID=A0A838CWL8_9BACI|nr:nucleoside deaminase [Halobacillus locisalis]MBA2176437.1 nucleoside deaminase [Halobacillus locisalis]